MRLFLFVMLFYSPIVSSQKKVRLDTKLAEISGLEKLEENLFVAHNDSGDGPYLYFLNGNGQLLKRTFLIGASNVDWEDIAYDGQNTLYVGDFGDNGNKRDDVCIYRIPIFGGEFKDSIVAERLSYFYPDRSKLKIADSELNFDVEAMAFIEGSLYLFSKNRTQPYDGVCKVYKIVLGEGSTKLECIQKIKIAGNNWLRSSITGADYFEGSLFLLTYKKVFEYDWNENELVLIKKKSFLRLKQRESICYDKLGFIWVGSEKSMLGKQHLKRLKWN